MIQPNHSIIFFTVATHRNHHLDRFQASAKAHGISVSILGMDESYPGHGKKRALTYNFLKKCDPNAIFMYVDAFDVIFLSSEAEIFEKYTRYFSGQLVYGGEQNLGMFSMDDLHCFLKYPIKNTRFKYLNAGTLMGPVQKGIALFEKLGPIDENQRCDQADAIRFFIQHPTELTVDSNHHIISVNGGRAGLEGSDYVIQNNRLYEPFTNTWPCLLHVPGKFFIGLDDIAMQLGYMTALPTYTHAEKKAYKHAQAFHRRCDAWGIENYVHRVIHQLFIIIILLVGMGWVAWTVLKLIYEFNLSAF
jgi:hypothetical protein